MRRTIKTLGPNTVSGFVLLIVLVFVNAIVAYWNIDHLHKISKQLTQTHEVLTALEQLLSAVKDAETGQRGYLITGDPAYLEPYDRAVAEVHERQKHLNEVRGESALSKTRLQELDRVVDGKFAELDETIRLMKTQGFEAAQMEVRTDRGRLAMEDIRKLIQDMREDEKITLADRMNQAERNYVTALTTTLLAAFLSLALVGGSFHFIRRELYARQKAEADAHQQREWYQTTLTSIGDAVIVTDSGGRIRLLNRIASQITGWSEDAIGQPVEIVFAIHNEMTGQAVESPVVRVLREGMIVGLANHTLLKTRDGREIPIDDSGAPIRDQEGRIAGVVLVFRDVTERRRAEAALLKHTVALQESDRRKDEFLAMLAHELRNPLAPIHNAVQILNMEGANGANFQWSLQVIGRQLDHLTRLVDDLLDVSRITEGKVRLQKVRTELAAIVEQVVETCRPAIDKRQQQLIVALGEKPIPLEADPMRLTQVFSNLLNNATKYTDPGGRITLTAAIEGREAVVRLRDTGVGIAPEMLPRIFDLFAQADKTLARTSGGLGIGLTLVRRLVELHGGRIEAHSEGLGKGSKFIVRLPLADGPTPASAEATPAENTEKAVPRRRILLVDDNRDSAQSLAVLLRKGGNQVELAFDGSMALEAAGRWRPDVILLDIGLPGMDGYEVARRLRQQKDLQQVQLIAMTGYGQEEDRRQAQDAGFNAHLVKPVDLAVLRSVLARGSNDFP